MGGQLYNSLTKRRTRFDVVLSVLERCSDHNYRIAGALNREQKALDFDSTSTLYHFGARYLQSTTKRFPSSHPFAKTPLSRMHILAMSSIKRESQSH